MSKGKNGILLANGRVSTLLVMGKKTTRWVNAIGKSYPYFYLFSIFTLFKLFPVQKRIECHICVYYKAEVI